LKEEGVLQKSRPTRISYINKKRECNWIGHTWCRNCLPKHVFDGQKGEISGGKTRKKT
jgi:hypothetical protein